MKQKESKPSLKGRPRNNDTFVVSAANIRAIRDIAKRAKVPIETVFDDVVEIGINAVPEIYESLIQYRKSLTELKRDEQKPVEPVVHEPEEGSEEPVESGGDDHEIDPEFQYEARGGPQFDTGPGDDLIGSGQPENGAHDEVLA